MQTSSIQDIFPLSSMQQGMLFHSLYTPGQGMYVEQMSFVLRGNLNRNALEQAFQQILDRHAALRTSFMWDDVEKPLQVVYNHVPLNMMQYDWRAYAPAQQQEQLEAYLQADRVLGFDLSEAPLMRLACLHLEDNTYQIVWSYHHILMDGWSMPIVLGDLFLFYEAACRNEAVSLKPLRPYREYISWVKQQDMEKAEAFWRQMLRGFEAPVSVGVERPAREAEKAGQQEQVVRLTAETTQRLQQLARQHKLTLNSIMQSAWALLLSHYSGQDDIVFGITVSGRPAEVAGVETMVGLFINSLPLRIQIEPQMPVLDWLKSVQNLQTEVRQYEYSPLAQIQGWSDVARGTSLFESLLVFENYPIASSTSSQASEASLEVQSVNMVEQTNYPLTIFAFPGHQVMLKLVYDSAHFAPDTIERMLTHLQHILENIASNVEQPLAAVSLLSTAERQLVLEQWNATPAEGPLDICVHDLLAAQVTRTPTATALIAGEERLSYAELDRRANQLAHYLQQQGVGPDVLVGVCMERSVELIVGLLGVLKAGEPMCRWTLPILKNGWPSRWKTRRHLSCSPRSVWWRACRSSVPGSSAWTVTGRRSRNNVRSRCRPRPPSRIWPM
ncbi:hypothetical protein KDW_43560 [Dictyobacter vulcani]|uniref:Condensation domain-containing protein n=1 Tax=Dictyobacter vulcani TaxID=2607529 RepID=A0A5J4KL86_9CHLR|nr:hypothetical protein KDW_43560 [Dictyobacter vulcani]